MWVANAFPKELPVPDTEVRVHDPGIRRAEPARVPRGPFRTIAAAFGALRRWWTAGRRYRPERRYMRGGGRMHGPRTSAGR